MNRRWLAGCVLALVGAGLPALPPAHAGNAVQQCRSSDGSHLYTDKPCGVIGARSVPMRDDLSTRLLRERMHEAKISGVEPGFLPTTLATMTSARQAIGRRSIAGGCARTPTQLAMDLRGAFSLGDVNRIAESYHWVGMSHRAAAATMHRLERLSRLSIVDAQYYDAQIHSVGFDGGTDASFGGGGGVMQVTLQGRAGASTQDFDVERYAGCYFVRF